MICIFTSISLWLYNFKFYLWIQVIIFIESFWNKKLYYTRIIITYWPYKVLNIVFFMFIKTWNFFCLLIGTKNVRNPWPNLALSPSRPRTIRPDGGRPALTIRYYPSPLLPVTHRRRWPTCRGHRTLRALEPPQAGTQRRLRRTAGPCPTRPLMRYLRPPSESNAFYVLFCRFFQYFFFLLLFLLYLQSYRSLKRFYSFKFNYNFLFFIYFY